MGPALNPWEDRARYRKATRLAAVLLRVLDQHPDLTLARLRDATPTERSLTAQLAKCHDPSDETWRTTIALVRRALDSRIRRAADPPD